MNKQTLFFGSALLTFLSFSICPQASARPYPADFEFSVAQGDGDPTELTANDINAVEGEEDVALLTAEGDFVIPTYLLPTQEETPPAPVVNVTQTAVKTPDTPTTPAGSNAAPRFSGTTTAASACSQGRFPRSACS